MIRKIFFAVFLLLALSFAFDFGQVFAQSPQTPPKTNTTTKGADPSTDMKSSEFKFDLSSITHKDIKEESWIRKGVNFLFERAITIMAATAGTAAVLMMAVGGFMMLVSAGREEMYTKGKGYVFRAMLGLVFIFGAYILVTTVQLLIKSIF